LIQASRCVPSHRRKIIETVRDQVPPVQPGVTAGFWILGSGPAHLAQPARRRIRRIQAGTGHELVHP
jgi:hypothetical protein